MRFLAASLVAFVSLGVLGSACSSNDSATSGPRVKGSLDAGSDADASAYTGAGGTSTAGGTCNPSFCPQGGSGTPCCVSSNGPCGLDFGTGCVSTVGGSGKDSG